MSIPSETCPMPSIPPPTPPAPAPTITVPIAPPSHVLRFLVGVGHVQRDDLNGLTTEYKLAFPVLRVAIAYDHRGYSRWTLDTDRGVLAMQDPQGNRVEVATSLLTHEEVAAVRFLCATAGALPGSEVRSNGWRAFVVEQLGQMVPLYDFDGDRVVPAHAVQFYQAHTVHH